MHAINETLISTIIFWHKSKVFVEMNGLLSSVNFYNKISFFLSSSTNSIDIISENIKKLHGWLWQAYSEICIIEQYLKSIAFTKFDNAQLLLAAKIRMIACSKEKRTLFKTSPKLSYKRQYFRS